MSLGGVDRPDVPFSDLVSDKSLDEVILEYFAERGARPPGFSSPWSGKRTGLRRDPNRQRSGPQRFYSNSSGRLSEPQTIRSRSNRSFRSYGVFLARPGLSETDGQRGGG